MKYLYQCELIRPAGLETPGVMHAHWYSASLDTQKKLISLYVISLSPPISSASMSAFENELSYARSPHDVAAVLRWGLRHLPIGHSQEIGDVLQD